MPGLTFTFPARTIAVEAVTPLEPANVNRAFPPIAAEPSNGITETQARNIAQEIVDDASRGYGSVNYADATRVDEASGLVLSPGARTRLPFDAGTVVHTSLSGPFAGHAFFANDTFLPLAENDTYELVFDGEAICDAVSTRLDVELEIGPEAGGIVIENKSVTVCRQAGVADAFSVDLDAYAAATFKASGGRFYVTASSQTTLYGLTCLVEAISSEAT